MQLIRRWGAEPEVRRLGFHCEHAMSIRSCLTGPEIQRVPFPNHVWTCAQDHLETILAQRAAATGARLRYGAELAALHPADGGMLASVAAPPGPSTTIRARYVVGGDGARSAVDQHQALDQYEQACKPARRKLLEPELDPPEPARARFNTPAAASPGRA